VSPSPPPSPQLPPLRSVLTPKLLPAAFAAAPPQVRRRRMQVEVSKVVVGLESADCCCARKVVSSALSSLSSPLHALMLFLWSFAGPGPNSQLVTSFLPAQSFCTQKWSQASNESQTLPYDPPRLCSFFSSVSSSSKFLALPCGTVRMERKRRATSEAVGCVVASSQVALLL